MEDPRTPTGLETLGNSYTVEGDLQLLILLLYLLNAGITGAPHRADHFSSLIPQLQSTSHWAEDMS